MRQHGFFDYGRQIAMAHRGDHRRFTENTLEAFQEAARFGFRFIESDIHATSDGIAVLIHDPDLQRIAGRALEISKATWSQVHEVVLPCGSRLGRLDEALTSFPEVRFNLDAKAPGAEEAIARAVGSQSERVCVGSFSHARNQRLRNLLPHAAHSASPQEVLALRLGRIKSFPADAAMIPARVGPIPLATRRLIRLAQRHGRQVHIWTVNERNQMTKLLDQGVNGLMTDQPETLKALYMERNLW